MNETLKLGVNPICWTNDDMPVLGGHISLSQCLLEASNIGFRGIEMGHLFPKTPSELYNVLEQYNLELVSGWYSAELLSRSAQQEWEAMQDHLLLLKEMNCNVVIFAETSACIHGMRNTPLIKRPQIQWQDWQGYGKKLSQLAEWSLNQGLQIVVHHHMGTVIQSQSDIIQLLNHTSNDVGLLLDTGHLALAGADIAAIIEQANTRIKHVHCKDIRPTLWEAFDEGKDSFLDAVVSGMFTVPGDGMIDFEAVLKHLQKYHYQGWLVVEAEQYSDQVPAAVYAKKGFDHLKHCIHKTMTLGTACA